jgi:hypothetical protein
MKIHRFFPLLRNCLFAIVFLSASFIPSFAKAAVTSIEIKPVVQCIKIGESVTFYATAYDENGNIVPEATFRWYQEGPGNGSPSSDGKAYTFTATSSGRVQMFVSSGDAKYSFQFDVGAQQVKDVQIRVEPNTAGELAIYTILFYTDECGKLSPGDTIYLAFPYGTTFTRYAGCNAVTVNGIPASYSVETDKNDNQIVSITVPNSFSDTTLVYIRICRVQNPRGGACYRMAAATSRQPYWALSNSYAIVGSIITTPTVEVEPDIVGEVAAYTIRFETSSTGRLGSCYGGYIMVEFPYGTKIPTSIEAEHILVNGQYCNDADPVINGRVVKIYPGMVVLEESEVKVEFLLEAGITNPTTADQYRLVVWTNADNTRVNSNYYRIRNSLIKDVRVSIDKPYINTTSAWKITFQTGLVGRMRENGIITIYFPSSVTLPETSLPGDIRVNGVSTTKSAIIEGAGTLKIPSPVLLEAQSPVEIIIKEEFGLQNPSSVGRYTIKVHTGKEGTNVESEEFEIGPSMIGDLSVRIESPFVSVNTSIQLSFKTGGGGKLDADNGQIYIIMPQGMYIPNSMPTGSVLINKVPMKTTPFLKKAENQIILNVPQDIPSETVVTVDFLKEAGLRNPVTPGSYIFRVATSREVSYISSPKIQIQESNVQEVEVDVLSPTVKQPTSLLISFRTGPAGSLNTGEKIYVFVDPLFQFPDDYQEGIVFNGKNLDLFPVFLRPSEGLIQITLNSPLEASERVEIEITPDAGFLNPSQDGQYTIGVSTQSETQTVASQPFSIIPLPMTEISVEPSFPDGENEWYVTKPFISFDVHSYEPESIRTWFSLNGEEWIEYKETLVLTSGIYEIQYYSIQGNAKEEIQAKTLKIDTLPPYIQLPMDNIYTNQKAYAFSITIVESHFLKGFIGEQEITSLIEGQMKATLILDEGENTFSILVFDEAGHRSEATATIILDQTPPPLEITRPSPWQKTIRKTIPVDGFTEPGAIVTLNGKLVPVIDGKFMTQTVCKDGINAFEFIAADIAGNTTKAIVPVQYYPNFWVQFVIGQQIASSSMGEIDTGSPIFLLSSHTMIPLTVFTKLLGCEIDYEPIFQIITITNPDGKVIQAQIENTTVTVNNEKRILPVPPVIRNGRTFIPLRFFAEEFGFIVSYIKDQNAIRMEYHEN